jgi:hypothetical protein
MHKHQLIEDLKQFGTKSKIRQVGGKEKPSMMATLGDMIETNVPELKGWMFDRDTSKYIDNLIPIIEDDAGMAGFLKMIDKTQGWWKGMVTVMNPGFVMR